MTKVLILAIYSLIHNIRGFRNEALMPWLAFIDSEDFRITPPDLFAEPQTCMAKQIEIGFKCHVAFISYFSGPFNVTKGITTKLCLKMATESKRSVLAFEIEENEAKWLRHTRFQSNFVQTMVGHGETLSHFKFLPNEGKSCFKPCKQFKQWLANSLEKMKSAKKIVESNMLEQAEVLEASCRIYGWRIHGAERFEALSAPVYLMTAEECRKRFTFWVDDGDLCFDNTDAKLCPPEAEGAPILCILDGQRTLVGMANKMRLYNFAGKRQPITVTKLFEPKPFKVQPRNGAEIFQPDLFLILFSLISFIR